MYDGKKSTAEKIVYNALDTAATKLKTKNNIDLFKTCFEQRKTRHRG